MKNNNRTLVSIASAARAWGMSERTLRRRIRCGLIEAVKGSSSGWFIEAATVHALLAARWCPKDPAKKEVPSR